MKKRSNKDRKGIGYVDKNGYPKFIDYSLIKCKDDLIFQAEVWMEPWYKVVVDNRILELVINRHVTDKAFRALCYIGNHLVVNNISYINGNKMREEMGIGRTSYTGTIGELKDGGFIKEIEFKPTNQSDRIFLVSPVYFWYGGPTRNKEIMKWYMRRN